MTIQELWESDFEFRKVAINYLKKFEKEMQDIKQRHDAWGSFLYDGLHYDLNLYIHENEDGSEEIRDCIYAVELNSNGYLQTSDNFMVIPETEPFKCDRCDFYQYYEIDEGKFCDGEFYGDPEDEEEEDSISKSTFGNDGVLCKDCINTSPIGATQ